PHLDQVDAVISTASGCGVTVKDYGRLLATDPGRAATADRLAGMTMDVAEYLASLGGWQRASEHQRVAWHAPCTLQHGQRLRGVVEKLLTEAGYQLTAVADPHLCCGSAGTYSVLQPALSEQLRDRKVAALEAGGPTVIATANVGCQLHLAQGADIPVVHWLTLLR
ncbi:MAG: heterodisulfide reductase-related iron-sulfur binding cluster, partial [Pseudomonadales bacterium]